MLGHVAAVKRSLVWSTVTIEYDKFAVALSGKRSEPTTRIRRIVTVTIGRSNNHPVATEYDRVVGTRSIERITVGTPRAFLDG